MLDTFVVDRTTQLPLTAQIGAHLRQRIERKYLLPGQKLSTVKQLAREYETSTATIQLVLKELSNDGLVRGVRGLGVYVRKFGVPGRKPGELWVSSVSSILGESGLNRFCGQYLEAVPGGSIIARDDIPDVVGVDGDQAERIADDLTDVADIMEDAYGRPIGDADFLECTQIDGRQVMLPTSMNVNAMFCNVDMFEANGIPLPQPGWTWQDCVQIAHALTRAQDGQFGFRFSHSLWVFLAGAWQYGAKIFTPDATQSLVNSDACIHFVSILRDLGLAAPPVDPKPPRGALSTNIQRFAEGNVAMMVEGIWMPDHLKRLGMKARWKAVPLPVGDTPASVLITRGLGIRKRSPARELAREFLLAAAGWEKWPDKLARQSALCLHRDLERGDEVESVFKQMVKIGRPPLSDMLPERRRTEHIQVLKLLFPALEKAIFTEPIAQAMNSAKEHMDAMLRSDKWAYF